MSETKIDGEYSAVQGRCVLLTGGAGYIATHVAVLLLQNGARVFALDNLSNSSEVAVDRVRKIVGPKLGQHLHFFKCDVAIQSDFAKCMRQVMASLHQAYGSEAQLDAAIHFAGLKAVGESVSQPLTYYRNNLMATINLLTEMQNVKCHNLVFSSSATVYQQVGDQPLDEQHPWGRTTNPYGNTKTVSEWMIADVCRANSSFQASLLRYFNPVGAHPSGLIGESPLDVPNNLVPFVAQVAADVREKVVIFGDDYQTGRKSAPEPGVRDYIHVMDLADGHLAALAVGLLRGKQESSCEAFNLGTGSGASVTEVIRLFEKVSGRKIKSEVGPRRPGDLASVTADPSKAQRVLGWRAVHSLEDGLRTSWEFTRRHPRGYEEKSDQTPSESKQQSSP